MVKSDEILDLIYLSDRFAKDEKGILSTVVAIYRSTGEVDDFSGNERVADFFYTLIKPLIDKEKEASVRTSRARAAAGSKGGQGRARKNSVANAKSVAISSDKANVANVANANFAKASVKESGTPLESGVSSSDVTYQDYGCTSNNVVDGGVNNNIYNTTTTKGEADSKNGGGEDLKENTTIINNDSTNVGSNPKRKSVVPTVGELHMGNMPDLKVLSTTKGNNVASTSDGGSLVSPEDAEKSFVLLKKVGVWSASARELACTIPYRRIVANVNSKIKDYKEGKVKNLGAVVVKAVKEDHALSDTVTENLRQPVKDEIPLAVLENAERITKELD